MGQLSGILLWASAIIFALIGVYFLAVPDRAAASIGVAMLDDTGRTDIRATYGGMVLGIAVFFGWAARAPDRTVAGLWSMILVYGGLALGRIVAIADGERPGGMMWSFLVIEVAFAVVSARLLRTPSSAA